jgi:hypothetical protein
MSLNLLDYLFGFLSGAIEEFFLKKIITNSHVVPLSIQNKSLALPPLDTLRGCLDL